ncbi:type II toxin-antitoxin system Phd/YefM family antitoxin [Desulfurispirillum indicum]|uniref:Antitoxin n=1 Tax=Desulfurispirillum indicum (strain ATCC BAA-1389 / DSM 22839 / S5) TaxID=653733 RepID=E6W359_DESIS|nr:type II toxin-antitoxin system Phd/YefM family antitoxin [Desulfurispirillum indicum]ADU65720.1 prevent-host-death family protein [Desulfurispirillum indicum S5]UCZ57645.1 type II toxin-antitoxin system Phd/YefM family antitoxin [Desulfurispirillum indicum]
MESILADATVSVTELKRSYAEILRKAEDFPVAILNHNRPEAYLLPAAYYERLLERLEDIEDALLIRERQEGPFIEVSLDDL